MKYLLLLTSLLTSLLLPLTHAAQDPVKTLTTIKVTLEDGTAIHATPANKTVTIRYDLANESNISMKWETLHKIEFSRADRSVVVILRNGDRMNGKWMNDVLIVHSALGELRIPSHLISSITTQNLIPHRNIALGKPVTGTDGASHGKGLAKHLTDGDLTTHAKPPASHFDYTIHLSDEEEAGHHVTSMKIHWGRFGDRFVGIRSADGEGWANAAWPGDYVTAYEVHYRTAGDTAWKLCHQWNGRPVDEKETHQISVEKRATDEPGCSSNSTTTISNIDLHDVTHIRVKARGGHWIGFYELEVFGDR